MDTEELKKIEKLSPNLNRHGLFTTGELNNYLQNIKKSCTEKEDLKKEDLRKKEKNSSM